MEWYYVCLPWLTSKCVSRVCPHQLSFLFQYWYSIAIHFHFWYWYWYWYWYCQYLIGYRYCKLVHQYQYSSNFPYVKYNRQLSVENHIKHYLCISLRATFGRADCWLLCRIFSKATATTGLCFSWCEQAVREAAQYAPPPASWPLTLKVISESRVTWAISVPILVFLGLSVLGLGPMYATDIRQTSSYVRRASSLKAPPLAPA